MVIVIQIQLQIRLQIAFDGPFNNHLKNIY